MTQTNDIFAPIRKVIAGIPFAKGDLNQRVANATPILKGDTEPWTDALRRTLKAGATREQASLGYTLARWSEYRAKANQKSKTDEALLRYLMKHAEHHTLLSAADATPAREAERLAAATTKAAADAARAKASADNLAAMQAATKAAEAKG